MIKEVSSVDRGAGEGVKVVMLKRLDKIAKTGRTEEHDPMPATITEAQLALLAKIEKRQAKKVAKKAKREGIEKAMLPSESTLYATITSKSDRKAFRKMDVAARADIVKAGKMPPKKKPMPPSKNNDNDDDDNANKALKSFTTDELAKRDTTIADLRKRLDETENREALEIAKRDAAAMGMDGPDAGELLMKVRKGDKDAIAKFEKAMTVARKALREAQDMGGIFLEFGKGGPASGATALDQLNAKAEEARKADSKLTQAQAFDKVLNDPANAELAKRERDERMAKINRAA